MKKIKLFALIVGLTPTCYSNAQSYFSCPSISVCIADTTTDVCLLSTTTFIPDGTWSSSDTTVATVDTSGIISGISVGSATITYTGTQFYFGEFIFTTPVTVAPLPTATPSAPAICEGSDLYLFAGDASGNTYAWTGPDGFSSTTQNPTITSATAAADGVYTLTVTSAAGCSATFTISATVGNCRTATQQTDLYDTDNDVVSSGYTQQTTGIKTATHATSQLHIYPNPAQAAFTIAETGTPDGTVSLKVINTMGAIVYNASLQRTNGTTTADCSQLPSGVYMLQLTDSINEPRTATLLIQR